MSKQTTFKLPRRPSPLAIALAVAAISMASTAPRAAVILSGDYSDDGSVLKLGIAGPGSLTIDTTPGGSSLSRKDVRFGDGAAGSGLVTGSGASLGVTNQLDIGFSGMGSVLTVSAGGQVSAFSAGIAGVPGSGGTLIVEGLGSSFAASASGFGVFPLVIGNQGIGVMKVLAGATATVSGSGTTIMVANMFAGTDGTLLVSGAGSSFTTDTGMSVGNGGTGLVTVSGGASLAALNMVVSGAGGGTLSVNGATVTLGDGLTIGFNDTGSATINGGGSVNLTGGGLTVGGFGGFSPGTGTLTVQGAGSSLTAPSSSQASIGTSAGTSGTMTLSNGASATFGHVSVGWGGSSGTLAMSGGASASFASLTVGGAANISGGSSLTLTNNAFNVSLLTGTLTLDASTLALTGSTPGPSGVGGGGAMTLKNAATADLGSSGLGVGMVPGSGSLEILGGSTMSAYSVTVGTPLAPTPGTGTLTVNGTGSKLVVTGVAPPPPGGGQPSVPGVRIVSGTVQIQDGGRLETTNLFVGVDPVLVGTLGVVGPTSEVRSERFFNVGDQGGKGTASITAGGKVETERSFLGNSLVTLPDGSKLASDGRLTISGSDAGSASQLRVHTGANPLVGARGGMIVGNQGYGELTVAAGGKLLIDSEPYSGGASGSNNFLNVGGGGGSGDFSLSKGVVIVTGDGSEIRLANPISTLTVGRRGEGSLGISAGARVVVEDMASGTSGSIVGRVTGAKGTVTVTGAGSLLQAGTNLLIGSDGDILAAGFPPVAGTGYGTGTVVVSDGATVQVADMVYLGPGGTLMGNTGSILGKVANDGRLAPGTSVGTLNIQGNLDLKPMIVAGRTTGGVLEIELAGPSSFDLLQVSGTAKLGGELEVRLLPGYSPQLGDSFKVLSFASFTGAFDSYDLPTLGGGLFFQPKLNPADLTLTVAVPEPETYAMFMAGLGVLAGLARRRASRDGAKSRDR